MLQDFLNLLYSEVSYKTVILKMCSIWHWEGKEVWMDEQMKMLISFKKRSVIGWKEEKEFPQCHAIFKISAEKGGKKPLKDNSSKFSWGKIPVN